MDFMVYIDCRDNLALLFVKFSLVMCFALCPRLQMELFVGTTHTVIYLKP